MGAFSPPWKNALDNFMDDSGRLDFGGLLTTINSEADLPEPSGGVRTLNSDNIYIFGDIITSSDELDPNGAPILGWHGSKCGFVHTGGGTAIRTTDNPFFADSMYFHSPGGTVFDLSASGDDTEFLFTDSSNSDAAGLGNASDLGTVGGFRVITFKGVNLEDFNAGLTITGDCDKVFFKGCPFRSVTDSNVQILEFDADFESDIVDMPDNYVKGVQSDTEVVHVDASATINEVFQYRGNTHDSTVTKSNILNGDADIDAVGYRVTDSHPLRNSKTYISYTLDSNTTVTISSQASSKTDESAYVRIDGATTERGEAKFTHSNNSVTYDGKKDQVMELNAITSSSTGTDDIVAFAWFKNGSLVEGSETRVRMVSAAGGVDKSTSVVGVEPLTVTDDTFDVRVANLGSTANVEVGELTGTIYGK